MTGEFKNSKGYHVGFFEGVGFVCFCMCLFFLTAQSTVVYSQKQGQLSLLFPVQTSPLLPLFLFHNALYFKKLIFSFSLS